MSLYKLLETFRALMTHPRQIIVAYLPQLCAVKYHPEGKSVSYNTATPVPFIPQCLVCASMSAIKPSNKLNKPNTVDLK